MAKNEDRQAMAMQYLQLLQSGVPAAEAFKQVYPKGLPTAQQQAAEDSKSKQQNQLVATGGTVAGLLGAKYGLQGIDALMSPAAAATTAATTAAPLATTAGSAALAGGAGNAANAYNLAAGGAGSLFGGASGATGAAGALGGAVPAAPSLLNTSGANIASSAELGGSALGAVTPYLGAAGAALSAYDIGKNLMAGKKMGTAHGALSGAGLGGGLAAAAPLLIGGGPLGWGVLAASVLGGAALGGGLGQIGHGKHFYEGEARKGFASELNKKLGKTVLDPELFRADKGSFTYDLGSSTVDRDLGAANGIATALTGGNVTSDKMSQDLAMRLANDFKGGASVADTYKKYGMDREGAINAIKSNTALDSTLRNNLVNGVNYSFNYKAPKNASSSTAQPAAKSNAMAKKELAQTGQFGNQLLQTLNKKVTPV